MSHKVSSCEVVVAGGGVIGAACARALAARGLQVTVCEPGPDPAAASPASAGMLAAQVELGDDELRALGVRGRELYDSLALALRESTGIDIGLWRDGIASLALDDASAAALRAAVARQRQAGLRCDWLEPADVAARVPGAAPCRGALFAPEDGAVDPSALTRALLADARARGVTILPAAVDAVTRSADRVTGVRTTAGPVRARHVVIAAGAWSPMIRGLPRPLPIAPVRGQMAATSWPAGTPRAIVYADHGYVLARGADAVLGSTMEDVGFDARVTEQGIAGIRSGAIRLFPALAQRPITRVWAGLRPVTPDGKPILGADPVLGGLWYATGHGRNGILLAGISGEIVGDLVATGTSAVDIAFLGPQRFLS